MTIANLGSLEKVNLRNAWNHEAIDFTNWLSREENLQVLSDEIGIDISLIQTEASVGNFNVDILAEEEVTGKKIIIENQLEMTNHDHLGKIITYASGHDAKIIIWIVKDVRDEHKQAIDWLNENTDEDINFFAIKMELWRIGNSLPAPKFQIISKPNDWAKAIKKIASENKLSETKVLQLEFWTKFREYCDTNNSNLRIRKPFPQHWSDTSIGIHGVYISLTIDSQKNVFGCALYIPEKEEIFYGLEGYKEQIEKELDAKLDWMELPDKKASRIILRKNYDFSKEDHWKEQFEWFKQNAEKFKRIFVPYIRKVEEDSLEKEKENK